MNLSLNESISFDAMMKLLAEKLPAYKIELKKNPVARFQYIQVRKSAYIGVWIRILPDKNRLMLIKTIPSTLARAFLGGIIVAIIASNGQEKLEKEIAEVLKKEFNTDIQS